jgi:glycosyltransferase involved in cell wall biosynthesis/GT2 family glycosyltransferase
MKKLDFDCRPSSVDVVVPIYRDVAMTLECLESVLDRSGDVLGRLIAVDDCSPDPGMGATLSALAARDPRVVLLTNPSNLGFVKTCNRALGHRHGDVVLLNSDTVVTEGWLTELRDVAYTDDRTACASPLSNNATLCSVPRFFESTPAKEVDWQVVRRATASLPRSTVVPTCVGFCLYMRGPVLDVVGDLDTVFGPGYDEENDWIMRAQAMGFIARRANHAFVYHLGGVSFTDGKRDALKVENSPQTQQFCASLEGAMAACAVRVEMTGRLRVALDARHVTDHKVGSNVYVWALADAYAARDDIELTLVLRPGQKVGPLRARLLENPRAVTDVDVLHRPAQPQPGDVALFVRSPAHLVITYQDLIAYHARAALVDPALAFAYRRVSHESLQLATRVIAYSDHARQEISREFGIPTDRIDVVYFDVDPDSLKADRERRAALRQERGVPSRYFLCIGTDFPHKNLANVVSAWRQLGRQWPSEHGDPPSLVMVGSTCAMPDTVYKTIDVSPIPGLVHYGEVEDEFLKALLQGAEALVFGSLYEGFGIPPLETMAAETPVIAMPLTSVPEICGDAAFYPSGLDPPSLCDAMIRVATTPSLREELLARGRARVREFSPGRQAEQTIRTYRTAVSRPPRDVLARRSLYDGNEAQFAGDVIGALERELAAAQRELAATRNELAAAQGELATARRTLDDMHNSITFKLGRPIYPMVNWLRNRKRR